MFSNPSRALVTMVALAAVLFLLAAVYLGGTGHIPLAMISVTIFVALGGCAFELARRRSV